MPGAERITIEGMEPLLRDLRGMDAELRKQVRAKARDIADLVAADARGAASTRAEVKTATTIRRSGYNGVRAGGGGRAGLMFFGTEFGGQGRNATAQFRPHRGKQGYFFWPTIRHDSARIVELWGQAIDEVLHG